MRMQVCLSCNGIFEFRWAGLLSGSFWSPSPSPAPDELLMTFSRESHLKAYSTVVMAEPEVDEWAPVRISKTRLANAKQKEAFRLFAPIKIEFKAESAFLKWTLYALHISFAGMLVLSTLDWNSQWRYAGLAFLALGTILMLRGVYIYRLRAAIALELSEALCNNDNCENASWNVNQVGHQESPVSSDLAGGTFMVLAHAALLICYLYYCISNNVAPIFHILNLFQTLTDPRDFAG